MHKHVIIIVLAVLTTLATLTPQIALGQVDAKEAYLTGKKLFEQGKFEEARDLFLKASFTDNKNAEVFLALGKANYQIGEIDKAMAAWTRTLQLAPKEAYAIRMLKALKGYTAKPAARIKLVKMLIAEDMHSTAGSHCLSLVRNEAATDAQRAEALRLHAEVLLETGKAASAVVALQEALAKYPTQQDKATTALLLGRARVKIGGKSLASGLDTLKSVVTDFAKTPQASAAQYELILAGLSQKTDAAGAASLKKWIAANATHRLADEATGRLISVYLALAGQTAKPKADAKLSQFEVQAITLAGKQIAKSLRTADAAAIHKLILTHIQTRYAAVKAYPAAISGAQLLLKAPLPKTARAQTLMTLAQLRSTVAINELNELARAGKLPGGNTPKALADAVAGFKAIMSEFPLQSTWANIAVLSHKANTLAVSAPFGPKVTAMKAAHGWAIEIALDVIKADADPKAVTNAMTIVGNIQSQYASFSEAPANAIPLDINAKLLAAVKPDSSAWSTLMTKQIDLLNIYTSRVLTQNIKAGRDEANKTLSDHQNKMLATMAAILTRDASQAPAMMTRLGAHLKPWLARGHYDLARKAYATLAAAMPASQKPSVQLAVTGVWVSQANAASARLMAAGFTVPRKLDPAHIQALTACYAMQAQRRDTDPIVLQARTIASQIVRHYTDLEYFDIAEQAIAVKAKQAIDTADAFAQISLAGFHLQRAKAELAESLKRYKAKDKIALTDAFKKAIGDYKKFITDRPTHSYAASAVQNIYGIARIFEHHKAYDVAIGVYKDFAAFAAKSKVLSQGSPASASQAEAAELVVANALYSKAENALIKSLADAKPNDPPPAKISAEFSAAIDAYKAFVKARPSSPLVGTAIARINKAAMKYVGIGSWDVAEGVFANLLAAGLDIRRPERIEFSRGLCRLGKVMPKHATDVLKAITAPRRAPRGGARRGL